MAKDMLDAIYNAEEDCRQREANARAESAERVEQTKADAKQVVLSAKEKAQKDADMLFEKTAKESKKSLRKPLKRQILSATFSLGLQTKTASVLLTGLYKGSLFKTVAMKEAW